MKREMEDRAWHEQVGRGPLLIEPRDECRGVKKEIGLTAVAVGRQ